MSLRNVGFVHEDGTAVLDGIDLDLAAGSLTAVIGPSGIGKTTLLRLAAGLLRPTTGAIRRGVELEAGDIGYVFQDATLMPWASVVENVLLPMRLLGRKGRPARAAAMEALAAVGMEGHAGRRPGELSGGMKMRVAVARALVTQPKMLLLDEPFGALDELTRTKLDEDLRQIIERFAVASLFVTHSVTEAVFLADCVIVLNGRPARVSDRVGNSSFAGDKAARHTNGFNERCRQIAESLAH
ncbi:MAG: ABC transporter ATP-binding protein [Flavobacteriaceae bacterium]